MNPLIPLAVVIECHIHLEGLQGVSHYSSNGAVVQPLSKVFRKVSSQIPRIFLVSPAGGAGAGGGGVAGFSSSISMFMNSLQHLTNLG